jgi:GntR family transcriptional regulator
MHNGPMSRKLIAFDASAAIPFPVSGPALAHTVQRYRPKGLGIAKYEQLGQALLGAIEDQVWRLGDKLPTESALASATPYSLGTVQNAYRSLVERGVVVRIQGRGTFVAERRHSMDAPWHCRFLNDLGDGFLPVYTHVLSRELTHATGPWTKFLGQSADGIVRIDRCLTINDEFDVYSKFFVRADRFGTLLDRPARELEGINFKLLLSREFGTPVSRLSQTLAVSKPPPIVCKALQLKSSASVTVLDASASTHTGTPVYFQSLYIPPNRRQLSLDDMTRS